MAGSVSSKTFRVVLGFGAVLVLSPVEAGARDGADRVRVAQGQIAPDENDVRRRAEDLAEKARGAFDDIMKNGGMTKPMDGSPSTRGGEAPSGAGSMAIAGESASDWLAKAQRSYDDVIRRLSRPTVPNPVADAARRQQAERYGRAAEGTSPGDAAVVSTLGGRGADDAASNAAPSAGTSGVTAPGEARDASAGVETGKGATPVPAVGAEKATGPVGVARSDPGVLKSATELMREANREFQNGIVGRLASPGDGAAPVNRATPQKQVIAAGKPQAEPSSEGTGVSGPSAEETAREASAAAKAKLQEEARLAEVARKAAERERALSEERRNADAAKAEARRKAAAAAWRAAEARRLAEARKAEEARMAAAARKAEQDGQAAARRKAEQHAAEEARRAKEIADKAAAEASRMADIAREVEEVRRAAAQKAAAELAAAEQRAAKQRAMDAERAKAEQDRQATARRKAEQDAAEAARRAKEIADKAAAEAARVAAIAREVEEARRAAARKAEQKRQQVRQSSASPAAAAKAPDRTAGVSAPELPRKASARPVVEKRPAKDAAAAKAAGAVGAIERPAAIRRPGGAAGARHRGQSEHEPSQSCSGAGHVTSLPGWYVVASGDSLTEIAKAHYGTSRNYRRILRANRERIDDQDVIRPCQRLYIPG